MFEICKDIKNEELEMRQVFAKVMDDLASEDERVVYLDADIINSIKMVEFSKKYPERTVNCGIQEANMIGVGNRIDSIYSYFCAFYYKTSNGSSIYFLCLCEIKCTHYWL